MVIFKNEKKVRVKFITQLGSFFPFSPHRKKDLSKKKKMQFEILWEIGHFCPLILTGFSLKVEV